MNIRFPLLVVALASVWTLSLAATKPQSVQVGSGSVMLSVPADYVDLCTGDQDATATFPRFIPTANALLACYTTAKDRKEWKSGDGGTFRSYLIATVRKSTTGGKISAADFDAFRTQSADSVKSQYQELDPQLREQIDVAAVAVSEAFGKGASTKLPTLTPIGVFDSGPGSFSTVWITTTGNGASGTTTSTTQVQISSSVLVKGMVVVLYTYGRFESPADVEKYKTVARNWVLGFQKDNP